MYTVKYCSAIRNKIMPFSENEWNWRSVLTEKIRFKNKHKTKTKNQTPCFLSCTESRGNKKRDDTEVEGTEKGRVPER